MKNSFKNFIIQNLKALVIAAFVLSVYACEDSVSPEDVKKKNEVPENVDAPRPPKL